MSVKHITKMLGDYLNPAQIHLQYGRSTPPAGALSADLLKKLIGGAAVGASIEGLRRLQDKTVSNKGSKEAIKDYLSTKYVSIPSSTEPDIHKTLANETKKEKEMQDKESIAGEIGKSIVEAGKSIKAGFTNENIDPFYLPASIAVMLAGFAGGQTYMNKKLGKKQEKKISEDIEETNRNIGRLLEEEYRRTRGEKTAMDKEAFISKGKQILATLAAVGVTAGLSAGYMKGRSENPTVILHKKLQNVIADNRNVRDAPKVIVPNTLTGMGEESKNPRLSQERVNMEELNLV